jgi:hypothetical protein
LRREQEVIGLRRDAAAAEAALPSRVEESQGLDERLADLGAQQRSTTYWVAVEALATFCAE